MDRLRRAIKAELDSQGHSQPWLAAAIDVHPSQVSRMLSGEIEISLERMLDIEDAFGVPHCFLFRMAGIVASEPTTRDAIAGDVDLEPAERRIVLSVYDGARSESQATKMSRAPISDPTATRTDRN